MYVMCRLLLSGFFTLTLLLSITMPAQASETGFLTYRFADNFIYHGAFHDSKAAWNELAQRVSAPQLRHDRDGRDVDILIKSVCKASPGSHVGFYEYHAGAALLWVNRCADLSWVERRKVYSHELGHALLGPALLGPDHLMGYTVLRDGLTEQQAVYPTAKDGQMLARAY